MEIRSIDFAKTATIDLMSLNNKVVNMRPIVKRSKAQIVNRLTRHITSLKKKKGTDDQKDKNIRKAERLIEEIESIRRLKEDKVSKYSLANTSTFESISKLTLLPNTRALARLANHHLMKNAVDEFRQSHTDWRDLAAFLLVKQTGRKFKTKKQKQKKLTRRVENINASETMTKAYILERFGQEGVEEAEQRFQKKRKKGKKLKEEKNESQSVKGGKDDDGSEPLEKEISKMEDDTQPDNERRETEDVEMQKSTENACQDDDTVNLKSNENKLTGDKQENATVFNPSERVETESEAITGVKEEEGERDDASDESDNEIEKGVEEEDESEDGEEGDDSEEGDVSDEESSGEKDESDEEEDGIIDAKQRVEEDPEESDEYEYDNKTKGHAKEKTDKKQEDMDAEAGSPNNDLLAKSTIPVKRKKDPECVVKELNIGASSDEGDSDSGDSEISIGDSDDDIAEEDANSESDKSDVSNDVSDESDSEKPPKKRKKDTNSKVKKQKSVPDFLIKGENVSKTMPNDPFFVGSDGEEQEGVDYNEMDFDGNDDDGDDFQDGRYSYSGGRGSKSMFYEPGDRHSSRGRFERRDFSSGFRSRGRGGFENRGRGGRGHSEYRGRGRSSDRGNFSRGGQSRGGNSYFIRGKRIEGRGGFSGSPQRGFKFGGGFQGENKRPFASQGSAQRGDKQFGAKQQSSQSQNRFGAPPSKDCKAAANTTEKLHPSWEASRKRKAEQSGGLKSFEGTKIVFDDD